MLAPDTLVAGKYVVRRPLDSGGMGSVYEAWENDLSRPVAIKLLHEDIASDPAMFARFRREAEAAASLGHPNIVHVLEFRNDPGHPPMLVMERLAGRSLRELLAEAGALAPPRAVFIALQILSALAAAHRANLVHRDIKPSNIFVVETLAVRDFVKVIDFGIAKTLDREADAPPLTDFGQVLGTASYMAPEQAQGLPVDGRADLFAVGGILFQALSGQKPRELGPSRVVAAGTMPCRKLLEVLPFVDRGLAAVIDRALALDPAARFPTAEAMAEALSPYAARHARETAPTRADDARAGVAATVTATASATERETSVDAPALAAELPSAAGAADRTRLSPGASYAAPPRAALGAGGFQGHAPPTASAPRRSRPAEWLYAVPAVVFVLLVLLGLGLFLFVGFRANAREAEFMRLARPTRCSSASACSATTRIGSAEYPTCAPAASARYAIGDVVFYAPGAGSSFHSARIAAIEPDAVRIATPDALELRIASSSLHGNYCTK